MSEEDYKEGLSLAQLAPGPLAAQLAIYLGWVRAGLLGATLVGLAFVGPSLIMVLVLSAMYVRFGGLPWMQGAFYGIGAAVIAIIAQSARKLTRLTLRRDLFLWLIFGVSALVTAWTESEIFTLFVGAGVVTMLVRSLARPRGLATSILPIPGWLLGAFMEPVSTGLLWTLFIYFGKASLLVFGSGLADCPVPARGRGPAVPLVERASVSRCRGSLHDYARSGSDHRGLHWLPGCRAGGLARGRARHVPADVPGGRACRPLLPALRQQSSGSGVRGWCDCRGNGRHCGRGIRTRQARSCRCSHRHDRPCRCSASTVPRKRIPDPLLIVLAGIAGLLLWAPAQ